MGPQLEEIGLGLPPAHTVGGCAKGKCTGQVGIWIKCGVEKEELRAAPRFSPTGSPGKDQSEGWRICTPHSLGRVPCETPVSWPGGHGEEPGLTSLGLRAGGWEWGSRRLVLDTCHHEAGGWTGSPGAGGQKGSGTEDTSGAARRRAVTSRRRRRKHTEEQSFKKAKR